MRPWEWELRAEITKQLEVFKGYGNDVFFPQVTKELIGIFRKYAQQITEAADA